MIRSFVKGSVALLMILSLSSCGYSTRSSLPASIRTICVKPFVNKIDFQAGKPNVYLPLMEVKARDAVVQQFVFDGNLRIAKEEDADMVLQGDLTGYDRQASRFTNNNDVQEFRIQVTMRLIMKNKAGDVLWEEPSFAGTASYYLTGPRASSESGAVEEAVKDLAKRIVERTVEDW